MINLDLKNTWTTLLNSDCINQAEMSLRKYRDFLNPVDTRTKNVRTKDVHKRTFIFGSIWKHGKTSQSEHLMNVPMWYV